MSDKTKVFLIAAIILTAAVSRLVEHPFNFTPIVAMAIFAGCWLHQRWGIVFPLLAMIFSDALLYQFKYGWTMFDWKMTLAVYGSLALAFLIGWWLRRRVAWHTVLGAALVSSVAFFIVTNFAVWALFNWYPHTLAGLANCFVLAVPFFRNALAGDLIYTGAFFGLYQLILVAGEKYLVKNQPTV